MPDFSLSVQYGAPSETLTRSRLRRWVILALETVALEWAALGGELTNVALTIRLVDAQEGQELNRQYRDKDYATNVLTFEYGADPDGVWHGDIVLCLPVLEKEAGEQNKPVLHHAAHLIVHGCLHALGYDHQDPEDAEHMEELEKEILAKMRIPDPYQHV